MLKHVFAVVLEPSQEAQRHVSSGEFHEGYTDRLFALVVQHEFALRQSKMYVGEQLVLGWVRLRDEFVADVLQLFLADRPIEVLEDYASGRYEHVRILQPLDLFVVGMLEFLAVGPQHPRFRAADTLLREVQIPFVVLVQLY